MQRRTRQSGLAISALASSSVFAAMSCADLGTYLAAQPNVLQVSPTTALTTLTTTGTSPRCEANFVYSSRGDTSAGYAAGQNQRIVLRVGCRGTRSTAAAAASRAHGTARCRTSAAAAWSAPSAA